MNFDELGENSAKSVWIPNRNSLFLNIAASYADAKNYSHIIFGANREEGATFPDNSAEFVQKINSTFEYSTFVKPKVIAPLINLDKEQIIEKAIETKAPLHLIRSCYTNSETHCGKCESCLRLKKALDSKGLINIIKLLFS